LPMTYVTGDQYVGRYMDGDGVSLSLGPAFSLHNTCYRTLPGFSFVRRARTRRRATSFEEIREGWHVRTGEDARRYIVREDSRRLARSDGRGRPSLHCREDWEDARRYMVRVREGSGASTIQGWNRVPATRVAMAINSLCPQNTFTCFA
jgi:hypothetical protein